MARIHLCYLWHMHQPLYKNLVTGEYRLPWARMHALKDYYGMVKILEEFPTVHQTFNLVPSLVLQIQDYAAGRASDPFLNCAIKPAEELSEAELRFAMKYLFQANAERLIYRYPRYGELYTLRTSRKFTTQEVRDLQVISQIAWFDEEFQAHDAEVIALLKKERDYSLDDQSAMARKQREIIASVLPVYKEFAGRGQIEISTTPYYHPILPLICDSNVAAESHPGVALPSQFRYPDDARHQLKRAHDFIEIEFGKPPAGLWPSEGSVSDEALGLAAEAGFRWAASDNGVLGRTLQQPAGPDLTCHSYLWRKDDRQIKMIFRDHFLSDLVGFTYSNWKAEDAAGHFLERIRENVQATGRDGAVLVPIVLDGENAWEYYYRNGRPFLRELYRRIAESPDIYAVTMSEALAQEEPRKLDRISPGSWIDANFDVWIGASEDNVAWEYLLRARRAYDEHASSVSEEQRRLAFEEMLIAEGSDWCWWYGPEHQSENRLEFDELYREHLSNVYRALGIKPPDELSHPILEEHGANLHEPPVNHIQPVIDGRVTSYFEWMGAGHYRPDLRSGAMHGNRAAIPDLYYGRDDANLYLRFETQQNPGQVVLRTERALIALTGNPDVASSCETILEIKIPLSLLGEKPIRFQVSLQNESIPHEGWIELGD